MQARERVEKALSKTAPGQGHMAHVMAGDVQALIGSRKLPEELEPLAMGVAGLPPSAKVFQMADLLRALLDLPESP